MPVPLSEAMRTKARVGPRKTQRLFAESLRLAGLILDPDRQRLMREAENHRRKRHHSETEDGTGNAWDNLVAAYEEDR